MKETHGTVAHTRYFLTRNRNRIAQFATNLNRGSPTVHKSQPYAHPTHIRTQQTKNFLLRKQIRMGMLPTPDTSSRQNNRIAQCASNLTRGPLTTHKSHTCAHPTHVTTQRTKTSSYAQHDIPFSNILLKRALRKPTCLSKCLSPWNLPLSFSQEVLPPGHLSRIKHTNNTIL